MTIREMAFQGLPLEIPVIDAHTHIGPQYCSGWHQKPDYVTVEAQLALYDDLGINALVGAAHPMCDGMTELTNRTGAEASAMFPDRVYNYLYISAFDGIEVFKQEVKKYAQNPNFLGIKMLGGKKSQGDYTDPTYQYACDFANEVGCPVLCHTYENAPPLAQTIALTDNRPNMKLLVAHQGGGTEEMTRRCAEMMKDIPNVYMELCGSIINSLGVEEIAQLVGTDRMIFGTDAIDLDPRFDFGKVAFSPLSDEDKKKVFAENYLKILETSQMGKIKL